MLPSLERALRLVRTMDTLPAVVTVTAGRPAAVSDSEREEERGEQWEMAREQPACAGLLHRDSMTMVAWEISCAHRWSSEMHDTTLACWSLPGARASRGEGRATDMGGAGDQYTGTKRERATGGSRVVGWRYPAGAEPRLH